MHLSTGHLSAWPNFSGSEESTSEGLLLCVFVCVCMCARACCSGCFLLAFLTGSWCGVQLRTGKRPFLSTVNHLREREKKKWKRVERKKRDQAAALIQPSAIWPASLSVPLSFHSLYLSVYLSFFCVCVEFFWFQMNSSVLEGLRGLWRVHKSCEKTGWGGCFVGRSAYSSGSVIN